MCSTTGTSLFFLCNAATTHAGALLAALGVERELEVGAPIILFAMSRTGVVERVTLVADKVSDVFMDSWDNEVGRWLKPQCSSKWICLLAELGLLDDVFTTAESVVSAILENPVDAEFSSYLPEVVQDGAGVDNWMSNLSPLSLFRFFRRRFFPDDFEDDGRVKSLPSVICREERDVGESEPGSAVPENLSLVTVSSSDFFITS